MGYWQQAIDRGAAHREDVFRMALQETAQMPMAAASWRQYAEANPQLLLAYAQTLPDDQASDCFALWWKARGLTGDLTPAETTAFYQNASKWATREQFAEWMRRRSTWQVRDHRQWARLLLGWGDGERAWRLLAGAAPEEDFPVLPTGLHRDALEQRWRVTPANFVNAQQLATLRARAGETAPSEEIILAVGARDDAPWWFVQKAAHIQARRTNYDAAATLLLRVAPPLR
jgi:hypothetical protein